MEIKYAPEQPMGQRRKNKLKNTETSENGNTIYQNLRDAAKAVLRGIV